jgi:hypothetical protein
VLEALARAGALYDRETRTGAMLGIPPHPSVGTGDYLLCLVTRSASEQRDLFSRIDAELGPI